MRRFLSITVIAAATACASHTPDPVTEPEIVGARLGTIDAPIKRGDCAEALRRAVAKPDMDVEKVPAPLAMSPVAIDTKKMPKGVLDKNKYGEIRIEVVVDTLGKPEMKTFSVVKSTHPWLTTSVKNAVAKWTFAPAEVAGCRVPRVYKFVAVSGKAPAAAAKATTKKPPQIH
jgi:hypothetical protein